MVVPLGIGVGDVIAVGKLAKRVVSELKNVRHPFHRSRILIVESRRMALNPDGYLGGRCSFRVPSCVR